ncbi:hypothetical protein D3C75_982740 [compost metagenome]
MSCEISGIRISGIESINTSTSLTVCSALTGKAPVSSVSASIVSGPRELATFTLCPAAASLRARVLPMWPVPSIPMLSGEVLFIFLS